MGNISVRSPLEIAGETLFRRVLISIEGMTTDNQSLMLVTDNPEQARQYLHEYKGFYDKASFIPKYDEIVISEWVNGKIVDVFFWTDAWKNDRKPSWMP